MKRCIIFIILVLAIFSITSCSWFDAPANAKKIGCGYIQNDSGMLFVEIDGTKYSPDYIYTGNSTRDGLTRMEPVTGMQVTVFYVFEQTTPTFIAGDRTEEYLEKHFSENYTFLVIFGLVFVAFFISVLTTDSPKRRIIYADD